MSTLLLLRIMWLLLLTRMIPSLTRPLALPLDHRMNVAWLLGLPQMASIQQIVKVAEPLLGRWLGSTDLEKMGMICQEMGLQWASPDPRPEPWRARPWRALPAGQLRGGTDENMVQVKADNIFGFEAAPQSLAQTGDSQGRAESDGEAARERSTESRIGMGRAADDGGLPSDCKEEELEYGENGADIAGDRMAAILAQQPSLHLSWDQNDGSATMPLYDSSDAWDQNSASSLQEVWYSSITGATAAPAQSKPAQSRTVSASQRRVISCTRCGTSVLSKSKKQATCGCGYHSLFKCTVCPEGSSSFTRCVC